MNEQSEPAVTEAAIADLFADLLSRMDKARDERFSDLRGTSAVKEAIGKLRSGDFEGFHHRVVYPLSEFVEFVLREGGVSSGELRFIFQHSRYAEQHFRAIIVKHEGSACCADKTRTIINALVRFYATGKTIAFDYNQEYTFHLPERIFKGHDEIVDFFKAIYYLYFGRSDDYLNVIKRY